MDCKKYISGIALTTLALATLAYVTVPSKSTPASPYGNRDMENIDLSNAYEPSQIYVSTLKTELVGVTKVEGTFTVMSQEAQDIVGDLQYSIAVSDGNDNRFIVSAPVSIPSLAPGATQTLDFSQDISALPNGTYKIVVQALHGGGRALGWATNYFTVSGSAKNVILLSDPSLVLAEFNNEKVEAGTGPNIDPGAPIGLSARATNNSATRVVAHPEVRIYPFNAARGVLETITLDPIVLEAHESKELSFTVPAVSTPGVYISVLSLKGDNGVNSNIAEYRTVTRGISADVLSARIATPGLLKGESTYITVEYAGSADAETYFTGSVQVDLQDSVGSLGQVMVGDIHMTDAIGSGMARVVLSRDMIGSPSMKVTIRDEQSHVLSSRTFDAHISLETLAELRNSTIKSQTISWYMKPVWALFAAVVLLALAGCILLVRRVSRMSFSELANLLHRPLAAVVILSIILANANFVDAQEFSSAPLAHEVIDSDEPDVENNSFAAFAPTNNGIVVNSARSMATVWALFPDRQVVSIFVNRPIHNAPVGTYECNAVPLEYRVEFGVCENKLAQAHVIVRADKNGGLQTTLDGVNANWKVVYDYMHSESRCAGALVKKKNICVVAQERSTTVNITPDAGKYSTTLQVAAKWTSGNRDHFLPVGDNTLSANQRDVISARNLWVNCSEPPRCGNAKVESPEQCDDGNPNNNDACTNQCQLTSCGDGIVQNPNSDGDQEQCDDANQNNNDACTKQCQLTRCGDGTVQSPNGSGQTEQCDDGNQNNDDSCNNSCQVPIPVTDLEIIKDGPATADAGDTITYKLAVTNHGPERAENIVVRDTIPAGVTYRDDLSEAPCQQVGNTVECPLTYLSKNQTRKFTLKFDVSQGTCGTVIRNHSSVQTSTTDTNPNNNQSEVSTTITSCPVQNTDITIEKSAPASLQNDNLTPFTYTLTVSNTTTVPAENVIITDVIPSNLTIASVPSGCQQAGQNVTCNVGTLAGNATRTIAIGVSAPARSVCSQTVTNTASVTTTTQEPNNQNNQDSAQTNFICTPVPDKTDVEIIKEPQGIPPRLNNDAVTPFNYTLTIKNNTSVSAANVVVTDAIPSPLILGSAPSGCTKTGNSLTCDLGTLAPNASRNFTVPVMAPARTFCSAPNDNITNTAYVTTTTQETNVTNNQSSATVFFLCSPETTDLEIIKTAPASVESTDIITYKLAVTNKGTVRADNIIVRDLVPAGLTYRDDLSEAPCNLVGNTVECPLEYLSAGQTRTFTIRFAINQNTCGAVPNRATVQTSTTDTNSGNNQSDATTDVVCAPQNTDLRLEKSAPSTLANDAVTPFTYTLNVTNMGIVTAQNVIITDTVPQPLIITSVPGGCSTNGNTVTCNVGALNASESKQYVISVSVPSRTKCDASITNTAHVTTTTPETVTQNNTDDALTSFTCSVATTDLEIIKTAPATVPSTDIITYKLAVTNKSTARADNIVVRDIVPTGLTYRDDLSEAPCNLVGNTVECPLEYLSGGQTRTFTIRFAINQNTCGAVPNRATVQTSTTDSNAGNNQSDATTNVTCPVVKTDLSIQKDGPATFHNDANGGFAYTIKVTNTTAVPAENVVMSDQIPAPLNLSAPLPSGCSNNGGMVECQLGTLAGNASVTLVIPVTISARAHCGGSVTNTARVITSTPETNMNNEDDARTTFTCSQSVPPISCPANGDIRMRIEFFRVANVNAGDALAQVDLGNGQTVSPGQQIDLVRNGVTVTDSVVPASRGLNVQRGENTLTFRNHGMASDFITREIMQGRIILEGARFTNFTNRPNVTDPLEEQGNQTYDENAGNDEVFFQPGAQVIPFYTTVSTGSDNFLLNFEPDPACIVPTDLEIIKTAPATVQSTDIVTYKLAVTNKSTARADNIIVRDVVPAGLTYRDDLSEAPCNLVGNTVECPLEYLSANQTRTFTIRFAINPNTCGAVPNRATVQTSTTDSNPANNQSDATTSVICAVPTDIRLEKSAPLTLTNDAVSAFHYTLTVTNVSATAAENVIITDTIPQELTITSVPAGCSANGRTITCSLPTLVANGSQSYVIGVSAPALSVCGNAVTNSAYATTTTPETITTNNGDDAQTSFTCAIPTADLSIVKTAAYPTVPYGSTISYVLTVTNNGPATATNVVVTDTFPSGFTYVAQSGATCSTANSVMTCAIPSIASQNTVAIQLTLKAPDAPVTQCQNNTVTNTATVSNAVQDPNLANNTSSVQTGLTCPSTPFFTITKTDNRTQVQPGEQLTYIVTVTNTSSVQATNVTVRDTLPSYVTYVTSNAGGVNAGQVVTWSGLTFSPLEQKSFTVNATVNASAPNGTVLRNIATVNDVVQAFDDTTVVVPVITGCINIVKIAHDEQNQPITPVPAFTFRLAGGQQVTSNASGQAQFTNVAIGAQTVTEDIPTGWTQTSVVPASGNVTVASGNQCATVTFTNKRNLSVDVRITKTGLTTVPFGSQITYSIVATNDGPADAQNVVIKDAIPTGMSFVSASGVTCSNVRGEIQCQIGSLLKNQSTPIITVTLTAPAAPTSCTASSVTNTAVVQTTSTDSNTANNTSSAVTQLTCPIATTDLAITKTGPSSVARGSTISYVITATNNGPATATNVVITDNFSPEFTYSTASGATCTTNGTVLTCNLGTMTSGQSTPITVTFNVRTISGTCSTMTVTNIATITSSTTDSNTSNNTSGTVSTQLTCTNTTNDISVYKTDNRSTANVLERLRYSIIITNNNSTSANDLLVTDNVPYGLTILTVSDGGTVNAQQVRWTNISVPANSSRTLYIDTEVRNDVSNGTVVTNTVDVSGKTATDQTTIYKDTYVNPPPYYPPNPPPYYPPNPPPYYPPNPPPYYPPNPPQVIYPQTGDSVNLFAPKSDDASITPVAPKAAQEDNGFSAVFYATLLAFVAAGSLAATRFISFGL